MTVYNMVGKGAKLQESITVTPTGEEFTVNPSEDYDGVKEVIVAGDDNLDSYNIRKGVTIYGVRGEMEEGSGDVEECNLTPLYVTPTGEQFTEFPDWGSDGFSSVTVAGDDNLIAENIAKDVTIYGVTGTHEGGSVSNGIVDRINVSLVEADILCVDGIDDNPTGVSIFMDIMEELLTMPHLNEIRKVNSYLEVS